MRDDGLRITRQSGCKIEYLENSDIVGSTHTERRIMPFRNRVEGMLGQDKK